MLALLGKPCPLCISINLAVFGVTWVVNLIPCFKCRKMSTVEKYFVVVVV